MKKAGIFVFVFTFTTIICGFLLRTEYINFAKTTFSAITSGVKTYSENIYAFFNQKALLKENEQLKKQLSYNKSSDIEKNLLKQENEKLHSLLSLKSDSKNKPKINANIIRINTLGGFTIYIDCGKVDGISVGNVAVWGNALVGKVTEVFDNFSVITPITAPDVVTGIINENEDAGLLVGKMELYKKNMCELSFFSDAVYKTTGSVVVTSGLSDTYPKGLLVGVIKKEKDATVVKTEVDFFKIRTLSLIVSG